MSDPALFPVAARRSSVEDLLERPAFRRELTPTWLSTAALLAGQPPLDPSRTLRYADLSCRSGVQAAVVAACHPDAEIWAVDHEPVNVEHAQRLARDAGLGNVAAVEWLPGLPDDGRLPDDLDVVVLDDVISTVDAARRAEFAALIARRVRPGGLVALSYRTLSAWVEIAPLRRLALLVAGDRDRPALERVDAVVDVLRRVRDGGASFVRDRPAVRDAVDAVLDGRIDTVERFLLTDHLEPLSLDRVADWLRPTGSIFVSSLVLGDDLEADSPVRELLADTADRRLRETLHDVATRPVYRLDLFRRGLSPLAAADRRAQLRTLELVPMDGDDPPRGPVDVESDVVVRDLLHRGLAHPRSVGWAPTNATERCRALNAVLACRPPRGGPVAAIPAIGSAIQGAVG